MENELTKTGRLLDDDGSLSQVGWSRQPLLDCNLENCNFGLVRPLQFLRVKRWDYYAIFTPRRFFSATIAHLGYAGNIFVYTLDFETNELHEEGLVIPFGRGIHLPRNSQKGDAAFRGKAARLTFNATPQRRRLYVEWPGYQGGRGLAADIRLECPTRHESMNITIPTGRRRFYFNRKVNCLPAAGSIKIGDRLEELTFQDCQGSLDWGRGIWPYRSYWNWASASGKMKDGRPIGLNFGMGFGDTSQASENCFVLNGRLHKLGPVRFEYSAQDYLRPWQFRDEVGRLELEFTPFKERIARTDLKLIFSEVHQLFGRYNGMVVGDDGKVTLIEDLVGFAEEHRARW